MHEKHQAKKKGSLAINQTMLLVLGMIVLAIIAAFYIFLGERAEQIIADVFNLPDI